MLFLDSGAYGYSPRRDIDPPPVIHRAPASARERGTLIACADGVAERPEPARAARIALTALGDSFYAAPEVWGPRQSLMESVQAAHQAVRVGGERGRAAALSALVLRGRRWLIAHAGHTRTYLYRDHRLRQLTRDHLLPRPVKRARVERACGLQETLEPEISTGEVHEGDIFLLTTAGAHEVLDGARMMSVLQGDATAQQMAEELIHRARVAGATNISVCVARVEKLPPASTADAPEDVSAALPLIAPPEPGAVIDDFAIERRLHKSRHYILYRAIDRTSGETVALRFPRPGARDDADVMQRFVREEWIAKRVRNPSLVPLRTVADGRRTVLYSIMDYQRGENLTKRIKRRNGLALAEALLLGRQLLDVLSALHAQGIVHRDVRPSNLLYDKHQRRLMVLGLGASRVQALPDTAGAVESGGLSYTAPEVLKGSDANERSDVYAAGVTLYRMITAQYPYGRIKAAQNWPTHDYVPMMRYKADVPEVLERAIRRACAADPGERYAGAAQFAAALPELEIGAKPEGEPAAPARRSALPWHWVLIGALLAGLIAYVFITWR